MPPIGSDRHLEIVLSTLAAVEERVDGIPLEEAAARVGLTRDQLYALITPMLFPKLNHPDYYDRASHQFLLGEDDVLRLDFRGEHWLRDMETDPPPPDEALRLFISGTVAQAAARTPPALDSAMAKLADHVAAELVVPATPPPLYYVCRDAERTRRSLRFRYVKAGISEVTDREMAPWRVFGRWSNWYCWGPELGKEHDGPKPFRIDRMVEAAVGDRPVDVPDDATPPDWFEMDHLEHRVTVVAPDVVLDTLPQPHRVEESARLPDGRVRAVISVTGDRYLDHVLVALGPDGEVLDPPEADARRRAWARELLAFAVS